MVFFETGLQLFSINNMISTSSKATVSISQYSLEVNTLGILSQSVRYKDEHTNTQMMWIVLSVRWINNENWFPLFIMYMKSGQLVNTAWSGLAGEGKDMYVLQYW